MKYSVAGIGMIGMGIVAFVIVLVFQYVTINNESDYYSLKEAMEASMLESIDWVYYRNTSSTNKAEIKIIEEKFVANFTKRFLNNTIGNNNGYVIQFYDIMEKPPKATVRIVNKSLSLGMSEEDFDVVNELSGILEANISENVNVDTSLCNSSENLKIGETTLDYYSYLQVYACENCSSSSSYNLVIPSVITSKDYNKYWISSVNFVDYVDNLEEDEYANLIKSRYGIVRESRTKPVSTCYNRSGIKNQEIRPDFSVEILNDVGTKDNGVLPEIKVHAGSSYLTKDCNQIFKYKVTWQYSYCE